MESSDNPKGKPDLDKIVGQLRTIRDEIRMKLHLAPVSPLALEQINNLHVSRATLSYKMKTYGLGSSAHAERSHGATLS
jgi:hypothetical protein